MRVSIAGGGRAAWTAGRLALRTGWTLEYIGLRETSQSPVPELLGVRRGPIDAIPHSDLIVIAVPDDALEGVGSVISARSTEATILLHMSGAKSSEVLAPHRLRGSMHPLASLPAAGVEPSMENVLFVLEGDERAVSAATELARSGGARAGLVSASAKPLYHIGAVFASNYIALLAEISREVMQEAGLENITGSDLAALARTAIANWQEADLAGITGPIARGDAGTIEDHLIALQGSDALMDLYSRLGLELAERLAASSAENSIYQQIAERLRHARSR